MRAQWCEQFDDLTTGDARKYGRAGRLQAARQTIGRPGPTIVRSGTPDRNVRRALPAAAPSRAIICRIARTVLVVDDDPTFRRLARRVLAAHGLDVVAEAGTVADALLTAAEVRPSAALVDVELPDGDGFALAGRLTAMPWSPRVVVTSVQSGAGFPAAALRNGAEAFVPKDGLAVAPLAMWLVAE